MTRWVTVITKLAAYLACQRASCQPQMSENTQKAWCRDTDVELSCNLLRVLHLIVSKTSTTDYTPSLCPAVGFSAVLACWLKSKNRCPNVFCCKNMFKLRHSFCLLHGLASGVSFGEVVRNASLWSCQSIISTFEKIWHVDDHGTPTVCAPLRNCIRQGKLFFLGWRRRPAWGLTDNLLEKM